MNAQEIFDKAVMGVINQGGPSVDEAGKCMYRGPNGLKCAVGHLFPDDTYYDSSLNSAGWFEIYKNFPEYRDYYNLIDELQDAHDNAVYPDLASTPDGFIDSFKKNCEDIAVRYGLTIPW